MPDQFTAGVYGVLEHESYISGLKSAAVFGDAGNEIGVQGASAYSDGVVGISETARGGVFSGGAAAVQLQPGSGATAPTAGQAGDLYVDSTGRLWYCRRSGDNATWVNLA